MQPYLKRFFCRKKMQFILESSSIREGIVLSKVVQCISFRNKDKAAGPSSTWNGAMHLVSLLKKDTFLFSDVKLYLHRCDRKT